MQEPSPGPAPRSIREPQLDGLRFYLTCDDAYATFTLTQGGEQWQQSFTDITAALDYAAERAPEDARITISNASGRVIVEGMVVPKEKRTSAFEIGEQKRQQSPE